MIAPHLYDVHYWFSSHPLPLSNRGIFLLLSVFISMICADIVMRVIAKSKRKMWDNLTKHITHRVMRLLEVMAIFGLVLTFLAYEGVPVLGSRYFLIIWGIITIIWSVSIAHEAYVRNPAKRLAAVKKGEFEKYFKKK